jgi:hypothetical protein
MLKLFMPKRIAIRFLAVPLIFAVFVLGAQAVGHFDGDSHDEDHCTCQICHIVHAAIPQPAPRAQIEVRLRSVRFAQEERPAAAAETRSILSIPRAPPV